MATAITYSTTGKARDLRTVVCEDVRSTVVLLPTGSLDIVQAKLLCGTSSRCDFWADELGLKDAHDFAVPAAQIVAQRPMQIAVKAHHKNGH